MPLLCSVIINHKNKKVVSVSNCAELFGLTREPVLKQQNKFVEPTQIRCAFGPKTLTAQDAGNCSKAQKNFFEKNVLI